MSATPFDTLRPLPSSDGRLSYHSLPALEEAGVGRISRLPVSIRIVLEAVLRHCDGDKVTAEHVRELASWQPEAERSAEIPFVVARVVLQDFTGVPLLADLAAMRSVAVAQGREAKLIEPLVPVDLVIDHSVQVDHYGTPDALRRNMEIEFERNRERYQLMKWGMQAFDTFRVVPPGIGIVHQVNLEYLFRGVRARDGLCFPDTLVGTDSHTTMINGVGVVGWGVGGIEAEAAMLGQPVYFLTPDVVGVELRGRLPAGTTATDLVLAVTEMLRREKVVGKFVEFFGEGTASLSVTDRATIANMAPEYGATCGIFPVDSVTIDYLRLTGRDEQQLALIEAYMKAMGMWHDAHSQPARYSTTLELDLGQVVPSLAGPRRPQDRIPLTDSKSAFHSTLREFLELHAASEPEADMAAEGGPAQDTAVAEHGVTVTRDGQSFQLQHGAVVIAAITSCTNTSNPAVLIAAGLVARKARKLGLHTRPWVKTSLAPGSKVVTEYLEKTGLLADLEALGFYLVGYGCTTCIGNSGPLPEDISRAIHSGDLLVTSVLSGNRNFEGRIHQDVRANYLASPPLVVAYALAGNMDIDLYREGVGTGADGQPVLLADIWPSSAEINELVAQNVSADMFRARYADVYTGNKTWNELPVEGGELFGWPDSTYVRKPTFFDNMPAQAPPITAISDARCLVKVGDSVTTDHISPAGAIAPDSPAAHYLRAAGVEQSDFNSYGSRRGNHEVMMRGTFANVRLRNELAPGTEGSWTTCFINGEQMSIFDAAQAYREAGIALIVLAGREYGTGSSRDWAAKGPALLGVRAVIAQSYERIHRSNLIGMGILPLQYCDGEDAASLGLTGRETFSIPAIEAGQSVVEVTARRDDAQRVFNAAIRIDTPNEFSYYEHGGILHYVLRRLAGSQAVNPAAGG
ncbi:MAG: aconitate hydratase AcnA [Halioglobus sp.]|nr:aconitate hydratase AcnA [Halioglobus sp.]